MLEGFVALWNTPSVVDWCEPNYAVTPLIAEFWNTTSSVPIAIAGLWGAWVTRKREESRFLIAFLVVAFTGFGSVAFHGTLVRGAQALDELPMIYTGLVAVWMLICRDRPTGEGKAIGGALATVAALFTASYGYFPYYFEAFLSTYAACVAFMVVRSFQYSLRADAPPQAIRLCLFASASYLGGFSLFWLPEHVFLGCDHPLQSMQLHMWWHASSVCGTYAWFLWAIVDRDAALQTASRPPSTAT